MFRPAKFTQTALLAGAVFTCSSLFTAMAAVVPAGVQLAKEQVVFRHLKDEPASLDPIKAVGLTEAQILRDLFEGLTSQDAAGKPVPGVATDWETSNNIVWTFRLRPDARWSNGAPVTAQDFVYSWRRLVAPENLSTFAWFAPLAGINNAQAIIDGKKSPDTLGVEALDAHTLRVTLDRPVPYFPNLAANFSLFPVNRATIEKYGDSWVRPGHLVSNGAFVLRDRVVNEKIELRPNNHYWDHAHTVLSAVTFVPINHESQATKRYLAGDLDITESFPKNQYQKLKKSIPDEIYIPDQLGTYYYAFNTQRAPTSDTRVRQALSMTIDRSVIAEKVLGTGEKPAWRFTPDVTAGFKPEAGRYQKFSQNELDNQAKTLLAAAGYGPHNPLKLSLLYNSSENHQKIAIAIGSMWKKKLGAEVKLINQEWKTYIDSRNTGNFDVIRASWVGDYNEPSSFLSLLGSRHAGNIAQYHNEKYDELLKAAALETDDEARNTDYNDAEKLLAEDMPVAPIYQYTNGRLIKPWLQGYPVNNPEDVAYSHNLYILKH